MNAEAQIVPEVFDPAPRGPLPVDAYERISDVVQLLWNARTLLREIELLSIDKKHPVNIERVRDVDLVAQDMISRADDILTAMLEHADGGEG